MLIGKGFPERCLTEDEVRAILEESIQALPVAGKRVLVLIPDGTRSMPMPQLFSLFQELLLPKVSQLDYLVALGTHQPMDERQLSKLVGQPVRDGQAGGSRIFNHRWDNPANFVTLGESVVRRLLDADYQYDAAHRDDLGRGLSGCRPLRSERRRRNRLRSAHGVYRQRDLQRHRRAHL